MCNYKIILGSQSPRRKELLAALDIPFTVVNIEADETFPAYLQAGDIPAYIAQRKAEAYLPQLKEDELLITADTIVWANQQMLGKPHDEADARRMLRLLSGNTHQVYTAVCLCTIENKEEKNDLSNLLTFQPSNLSTFVDRTDVTFREMSDTEIDYYISHFHPMDKAGAYGIQEWIGAAACTSLSGSYFNVMGLPTHRLQEALKKYMQG